MESAERQEEDGESESLDGSDAEEETELKDLGDNTEGPQIEDSNSPGTVIPSTSQDPGELRFDELEISDLSDRSLSRSPPRSQRPAVIHKNESIKTIVSSDMRKKSSQQQRKYHSKRSTRNAGRQTGSKAKQDKRVKVDSVGFLM